MPSEHELDQAQKADGERYWDGKQWTDEGRDAPPTKRKRRGGTFLKVVLGVIVGSLIIIGGCTALIGIGLNSKSDKGITRAQFDAVPQGTSQADVETQLGKPENAQQFENKIPGLDTSKSSCVYYQEKGKKILEGNSFQLCFDGGALTSKNAY